MAKTKTDTQARWRAAEDAAVAARSDASRLRKDFEAAVAEGDVDRAVQARRLLDDQPLRLAVTELVAATLARVASEERRAELEHQLAAARAKARPADEELAHLQRRRQYLLELRPADRSAKQAELAALEEEIHHAERAVIDLDAPVRILAGQLSNESSKGLDIANREVHAREVVLPTRLAPVVRSLPHAG